MHRNSIPSNMSDNVFGFFSSAAPGAFCLSLAAAPQDCGTASSSATKTSTTTPSGLPDRFKMTSFEFREESIDAPPSLSPRERGGVRAQPAPGQLRPEDQADRVDFFLRDLSRPFDP